MTARSWLTFPRLSLSVGVCAGLLNVACGGAAVAPKELVDARASYERVAKGQTTTLAPAELDSAKQALGRAEGNFAEDGDSTATRDLAYVAERKALAAESTAAIVESERERATLEKDLKDAQLASIDKAKADLEKERQARQEAEKKAQAAMASLAEIAKVKQETRGVVITLSGSVLFATGKNDLLPIAKDKLNEVAKALKDQGFKEIVVEGHTDSRGNAQMNQDLSLKRAESVRAHLVSQGVPADKAKAVGLGPDRPVADNNTAEGRANNRRVEIVVTPLK